MYRGSMDRGSSRHKSLSRGLLSASAVPGGGLLTSHRPTSRSVRKHKRANTGHNSGLREPTKKVKLGRNQQPTTAENASSIQEGLGVFQSNMFRRASSDQHMEIKDDTDACRNVYVLLNK